MKNNEIKQSEATEDKKIALHYMKTLVDVARESFLILDADLRVVEANPTFYNNFKVTAIETENVLLYKLGSGQWDIPELKKLLEEVLPEKKDVRNYEVTHNFETIGAKTIVLNAKQIDSVQLIIVAMEDVTKRKELELKISEYTKELEVKVAERTVALTDKIKELESLNKTMVDRELKMVELKGAIEELKKQ